MATARMRSRRIPHGPSRPRRLSEPTLIFNRAPATRYGASGRFAASHTYAYTRLAHSHYPSPSQDMQCVENCDDRNPAHHVLYEQPVWQTLQMFRAYALCALACPSLIAVTVRHSRRNALYVPFLCFSTWPSSPDATRAIHQASFPSSSLGCVPGVRLSH